MTGAERKRKWRSNAANKAAENAQGRARETKRGCEPRRATTEGRLAESIRDTLRHIRAKESK